MSQRKDHWEQAWKRGQAGDKSWFQEYPRLSVTMIRDCGQGPDSPIIDVGGGASSLVDVLLEEGYSDLAVLDISRASLDQARERLGAKADQVEWICTDITRFQPRRQWSLWHDRAVFHFLTRASHRESYKHALDLGLAPGGYLVISTFAEDGPRKCSGLDVVRYGEDSIRAEFGEAFELIGHQREAHPTPMGTIQQFGYYRFRKKA